MSSAGRVRTTSAYEEKNVQEFVDATLEFDANINYFGAPAKEHECAAHILLIGNEAQFAETNELRNLPFWSEVVEAAITDASAGTLYWTTLFPSKKRVAIALISSVASRHNCPHRPDLIISAISEAFKAEPNKPWDIFVRCPDELVVASAVAKGTTRPFSAKAGKAEKSYRNIAPPVRVFLPKALKVPAEQLRTISNNIQLTMRLVDAPTNLLDTTTFPEICAGYAKKLGFTIEVIAGEALREAGYGGLYGVGKAAEFPPALVTMQYKPKGGISPKEKIALVGKGIVYDTGGLAIKTPATGMCTMKCDMGGAAAVFGGFLCAVALEVDREVSCILCLADNAIGPRSQRNDDIVRLKSGLTIEINNTDAEGRLVLSDGVFHASQLKVDTIIDMATLTGAQGIATGKNHAAVFTNSAEWESRMVGSGLRSGDMLMPILYCPEYHNPEFSSKVADFRNSVRDRSNAQSSCAGQFIANNLRHFHGSYVHVDLAAPAFINEQATGYGVALLVDLLTGGKFATQ